MTALSYAFMRLGVAARKAADALQDLGLSMALGEVYSPSPVLNLDNPYHPDIIADFERDSGGTIEEIERFEESLGVEFP